MNIIKRKPVSLLDEYRDFRDSFSSMVSRFFDDDFFSADLAKADWNPRVDVYEKDNNIIVKADIPGIDEKNLDVQIEGNILTIRGSKEEEHEVKEKNYHRIERSCGSFSRTIPLPEKIEADKIEADYKKGVLTITIPKSKEAIAKKINVKVS